MALFVTKKDGGDFGLEITATGKADNAFLAELASPYFGVTGWGRCQACQLPLMRNPPKGRRKVACRCEKPKVKLFIREDIP